MTTTRVAKPCCPAANDADASVTMKMSVRGRKGLIKSMMWTYPFSAYLWALGAMGVGLLYLFEPEEHPPADIPLVTDWVWGLTLTVASALVIYFMRKECGRAVQVSSFVISLLAFSLFIASAMEYRPVSTIAAVLTSIYYAYSYLTATMIPEMRAVRESRKVVLLDELDSD